MVLLFLLLLLVGFLFALCSGYFAYMVLFVICCEFNYLNVLLVEFVGLTFTCCCVGRCVCVVYWCVCTWLVFAYGLWDF